MGISYETFGVLFYMGGGGGGGGGGKVDVLDFCFTVLKQAELMFLWAGCVKLLFN